MALDSFTVVFLLNGPGGEPQTLVEKGTGSKITPEPYVRYLTKKYSEIYGF